MLLAIFFHRRPKPIDEQVFELRRWFWGTSWASSFAGANSTMLRRAISEMTEFATRRGRLALDWDGVQPMPESFNLNSARTRAYVIWEMGALPHRLNALGDPVDLMKLMSTADNQVYRQVVPADNRPANRLVLPTPPKMSPLRALTDLDVVLPPSRAREVLASHGIPVTAWHRLREGGIGRRYFVDERTEYLSRQLRGFAAEVGVPLNNDLVGVADDDTE